MAEDMSSQDRGGKAKEIATCLGYLHSTSDADYLELVGDLLSSLLDHLDTNDENLAPKCVNLWELRRLAIQPDGLLSQPNRRLAWLKLCGGDGELFGQYNGRFLSPTGQGYDEIRRSIESVMAPSRWHISKERRRLRKAIMPGYHRSSRNVSSNISAPGGHHQHPSSIGTYSDGSSTPLTANGRHSMAGTPRSYTFSTCSSLGGAPFGSLAGTVSFKSLSINTNPSLDDDDSAAIAPSPLSHSSNPCSILKSKTHFNLPQDNLIKPKAIRIRGRRKDRRPQERKLIVQIATSAFYFLHCDPDINVTHFHSYAGLQDLIAVLLLNLESPSLTSFTLKQILKGHLHTYCSSSEGNDDDDSFASCLEEADELEECYKERRCLHALSFFPVLQAIDGDLHSAATKLENGSDLVDDVILPVAYVVERWISNWLCSLDTLPVSLISRLVDFFLSSHPAMPLYLVIAIVAHPINRRKFLMGCSSDSPSPRNVADINIDEEPTFLEKLERMFIELPQETILSTVGVSKQTDFANEDLDTDSVTSQDTDYTSAGEHIAHFMEEAIATSTLIMKTIPPHSLYSLTSEYQEQCLVAHLPRGCDSISSPEWSKRISTRTDYDVIDGAQSTGLVQFCRQDERYSCAYDASGLDVNEIYSSIPRDWTTIKKHVTAPKLVAFGLTLCLSAAILQNQTGNFSGNRNLIDAAPKEGLEYTTIPDAISISGTLVDESRQLSPNKFKSRESPRKQAKATPLPNDEKLEQKNEQATKLQDSKTSGSLVANKFDAEDLFELQPTVKTPQLRHPQPPKESLLSLTAFQDPPEEKTDNQPLLGDTKAQESLEVKVGCGPRSSKYAISKKKREKSRANRNSQVTATPTTKKIRFGKILDRAAKSLRVLRKEYKALVENDDYIL